MEKREIVKKFSHGLVMGSGLALSVLAISGAYAAFATLTASPGETLTKDKWNEMIQYAVPPGAVMAFNLASCPANWSEADGGGWRPNLRGQFIRGLNSTATGIDKWRTLWSWQKGSLNVNDDGNGLNGLATSHWSMSWALGYDPVTLADYPSRWHSLVSSTPGYEDYYNGYAEYWGITRPTNVALLYCIKN